MPQNPARIRFSQDFTPGPPDTARIRREWAPPRARHRHDHVPPWRRQAEDLAEFLREREHPPFVVLLVVPASSRMVPASPGSESLLIVVDLTPLEGRISESIRQPVTYAKRITACNGGGSLSTTARTVPARRTCARCSPSASGCGRCRSLRLHCEREGAQRREFRLIRRSTPVERPGRRPSRHDWRVLPRGDIGPHVGRGDRRQAATEERPQVLNSRRSSSSSERRLLTLYRSPGPQRPLQTAHGRPSPDRQPAVDVRFTRYGAREPQVAAPVEWRAARATVTAVERVRAAGVLRARRRSDDVVDVFHGRLPAAGGNVAAQLDELVLRLLLEG
jgi:hypothetical protein